MHASLLPLFVIHRYLLVLLILSPYSKYGPCSRKTLSPPTCPIEIKTFRLYSYSYNCLLSLNWCGFLNWLCGYWIFVFSLNCMDHTPVKPSPLPSYLICPIGIKNLSPIVILAIKVYCHWTDVWFLNWLCGYWTFDFSLNWTELNIPCQNKLWISLVQRRQSY